MRTVAVWVFGGLLAGLLIGAGVLIAVPASYVSRANVHVVPSAVPAQFVPAQAELTVESARRAITARLYSREAMRNLIMTCDLFPDLRTQIPMEDVIELMQKRLSIRQLKPGDFEIAFTYSDPEVAQRVTSDVTGRLIDGTNKERVDFWRSTIQFLRGEAEQTWRTYEELGGDAHAGRDGLRPADPEAAQQDYEKLLARIAEAETAQNIKGTTLEWGQFWISTVQFLRGEAERVLNARRERHVDSPKGGEVRQTVDRQAARQQYARLLAKIAEAEEARTLVTRHSGGLLEVSEAATKPEDPEPVVGVSRGWLVPTCCAAGAVLGFIAMLTRRAVRKRAPAS